MKAVGNKNKNKKVFNQKNWTWQ